MHIEPGEDDYNRLPLHHSWDIEDDKSDLVPDSVQPNDPRLQGLSIGRFLHHAANLQELDIRIKDRTRTYVHMDKLDLIGLVRHTWPRLHTLQLKYVTACNPEDPYTLIKNHQTTLRVSECSHFLFTNSGDRSLLSRFSKNLSVLRRSVH